MSGYKGYKQSDNARRKMNNTGEELSDVGPNHKTKSWSTKPGQLTAQNQAELLENKHKHLNTKQPVKTLSPDEIAKLKVRPARPKTEKPKRPVVLMTDEQFKEMMAKLGQPK